MPNAAEFLGLQGPATTPQGAGGAPSAAQFLGLEQGPQGGDEWSKNAPLDESLPHQEAGASLMGLAKKYGIGALETAGNIGSGMVAFPAAGANSLLALASGEGARGANQAAQNVLKQMTYQPRTQEGQQMSGAVNNAMSYLGPKEGDAAANALLKRGYSPMTAGIADTAINAIPMVLGARAGEEAQFQGTPRPEAVQGAVDQGFVLSPSEAGAGTGTKAVASIANRAQLEREASLKNYPRVVSIVKDEAGIPQDMQLNAKNLNAAKAQPNAIYDRMAALGNITTNDKYRAAIDDAISKIQRPTMPDSEQPTATLNRLNQYRDMESFDSGDAVKMVRELRADASKQIGGAYNPDTQATGFANRSIADALEGAMEDHLGMLISGQRPIGSALPTLKAIQAMATPQFMNTFKTARAQLAKLNNISDSMDGQYFSPKRLEQVEDHGAPLSGGLKDIADMHRNFDRSFQSPGDIRDNTSGIIHGMGYGGIGAMMGEAFGHGPMGLAAGMATGYLAPLAIRKAMLSNLAQRYITGQVHPTMATPAAGAIASQQAQQVGQP